MQTNCPLSKHRIRFVFICWVLCTGVLSWTACRTPPDFEQVYKVVVPATLRAGMAIPVPQQAPILTVTGKVGTTNRDQAIVMDLATVEKAGLVEYTVNDPFESRPVRYSGVLMRDLLDLWQVADDAQTVHIAALNDYKIDIPIREFRQYPILFAVEADGVYMQPDYRGPAMLVYPVDQYEFDSIAVQRNWIWQIKTIDIQ